jgi:hypothetical protein
MDEMQDLLDELESYSDVTRAPVRKMGNVVVGEQHHKAAARGGGVVGRGVTMPMIRGKAKTPAKAPGKVKKHTTYGKAPVGLLAEFLVLVSSGKMQEALELSNEILKFEPDNPLIKMYQEAMREYVQLGLHAEGAEESEESDGGEEDGEEKTDENDIEEEKDDDEDEDEDEDDDEEEEEDEEEEGKTRLNDFKEEQKESDEERKREEGIPRK